MLKRKSQEKNCVEAERTEGIRSLLKLYFLMLCSSCKDMSLYDSKNSVPCWHFYFKIKDRKFEKRGPDCEVAAAIGPA